VIGPVCPQQAGLFFGALCGAIAALQTRAIAIIYSVFSQQGFFTSYLGLASR